MARVTLRSGYETFMLSSSTIIIGGVLRVLLTVHQFLPKHGFGTERLTFDTGQELLRRGHEVYVLTTDVASSALPHDSTWDYDYKGLGVRTLGLDMRRSPDPLRYEYDNPRTAEHMRAYMRRIEPDLVHVVHAGRLSGSIVPAAKEFGVPVVFTATDFWSVCRVIHLKRADTGELCLGPDQAGTNCLRCFMARAQAAQQPRPAPAAAGTPQTSRGAQSTQSAPIISVARGDNRGLPVKVKGKLKSYGASLPQRSDAELRAYLAVANSSPVSATKYGGRARAVVDRIGFLRDVVNSTDRVIAPTRLNRDLLIRNGIDPHLITLSHYGMDTSEILTAPRSPENPPTLRFGYIGSLARHKGADTLIKAFKDLPRSLKPAELKVYGSRDRDAAYSRELEELVRDDRRVRFEGTFEGEKLGWVLSEIDVLVVPSRWYENTPLVVYSAFASGTPVIATDVGGLSEAIEHEKDGLLFEMDNAADLSAKLLRFLLDPELIGRLRSGMGPVKTARESVDELEGIYEELLGRTAGEG